MKECWDNLWRAFPLCVCLLLSQGCDMTPTPGDAKRELSSLVTSIPPSFRNWKTHHTGGREWTAVLYCEADNEDFVKFVSEQKLESVPKDDPQFSVFKNIKARWLKAPGIPQLQNLEEQSLYFKRFGSGERMYVLANQKKTEIYILLDQG